MSKKIFFKTVKSDGASVWAPEPLGRKYEIGKNYKFSEKLPAHVFDGEDRSLVDNYRFRVEKLGGNRVLICWGNIATEFITIFDIYEKRWFEEDIECIKYKYISRISTNFEVIGEIFVPQSWRNKESPRNNIKWIPLQKSLDGVSNKH